MFSTKEHIGIKRSVMCILTVGINIHTTGEEIVPVVPEFVCLTKFVVIVCYVYHNQLKILSSSMFCAMQESD